MPVSTDLLKALAEDPKSLEHQLGCMAGLFQIFDRQGLGRRYGSKRVSNAGSGQSQPASACETPRHDHHHHHRHSNNPYWMFEEDTSQRISGDSFERVMPKNVMTTTREPHHRPVYSDSSEMFTKSFETPTESRTSPDEKSNLDQSPLRSEESSVIGAWDPSRDYPISCTTSRYPSFEHHGITYDGRSEHHCKKQLNVVVPARALPTSDIRDIVRASFERDHQRPFPSSKDKPRLSVDAGSHGQYLKNLPRSASVDGKDRSVADPPHARHPPADLPRSSSVGGRGASLADWKDGLRSSSGSPRLTSKERDALVQQHKQKSEGRDGVTRLTVELREGPRLSVSVDDRRASVDVSPRPISRFRDVPCELLPNFNRAADIKEFLRGEKRAGRDGHRFSVDGTRDAPRASVAPRLSVDGRDNDTGTLAARKLKLIDPVNASNDATFCRQASGRKTSNVVARLMGLDELLPKEPTATPSKAAATTFSKQETGLYDQAFLHNPDYSPPPPPSPPDGYDYAHHASDHEAFHRGRQQQQQRFAESSMHDRFVSKHQHQPHSQTSTTPAEVLALQRPLTFKDSITTLSEDQAVKQHEGESMYPRKTGDEQKDAPQSARKATQGRRSLWHIFEAMQLKGLLHGSSRRKQAEALRLKEKECHNMKEERRSQSLPPRLSSSAVSKDGLEYEDRTLSVPAALPRAVTEAHKGSGLQHGQTHGAEESCVVVKPIITRSLSCKAPAAAASGPSSQPCAVASETTDDGRRYYPDEDTTPRTISRALSKSVGAYYRTAGTEQELTLQQPADSACSVNVRPSRKERGGAAARMTKSLSDVPQTEQQQRDSSPRCLRGAAAAAATTTTTTIATTTNTQESRPARSCSPRGDSSPASLRCPVEAGKARRKAFAVKDREENKASLVHLRANATKQEFLKERASGDPDTPRLLRRSSSECKLLSKIAESKPVITDKAAAVVAARSASPPNMTLLGSRRPVSKDNNKPLMKTRPSPALGLKSSVSKSSPAKERSENMQASHVIRPAKSISNSNSGTESHQPAESKQVPSRCSVSEVRATHGGALDQSGETTHANARENNARTESKARVKGVELDEGVKTPRGVSIKKIDFLEDAQAEVAEQPSPVSVLDNSHFDEELTPSPKAGKTSVVSLHEQSPRSEKDRRWSSARFLDLDLEETPQSAASSKPTESAQTCSDAAPGVTVSEENHASLQLPKPLDHPRVCLKDADEEILYVQDLLQASSVLLQAELQSSSYVIDPIVFDQLESKRADWSEQDALERRILFDCVNEVLERLLLKTTQQRRWWSEPVRARTRAVGVKEVMAELQDMPCAAAEDVCDTVYVILHKDLMKGRGGQQQWCDHHTTELDEVGVAVERMIVKDLVDDTVRELSACPRHLPESSRRQLFA